MIHFLLHDDRGVQRCSFEYNITVLEKNRKAIFLQYETKERNLMITVSETCKYLGCFLLKEAISGNFFANFTQVSSRGNWSTYRKISNLSMQKYCISEDLKIGEKGLFWTRVQAAEMCFPNKMMMISWTAHTSNEDVLRREGTERGLLNSIRTRQMMRREGLEHRAFTGKIDGKRGSGRTRVGYVKALSTWAKVEVKELMKATKSRVEWRAMTANALKEHST